MSTRSAPPRPRRSQHLRLAVGLVGLALVGSACSDSTPAAKPTPQPTQEPVSEITLGMYGHEEELAVHQRLVQAFNAEHSGIKVTLKTWPDQAAASAAIRSGDPLPDVFLSDHSDFSTLLADEAVQPVSSLLDERGISFGDRFNRESLEGFSSDNLLQCMPYELSPTVVYYDTDLVDLEAAGITVPEKQTGSQTWSFEQFSQVAREAARPKRRISGLAVEASLSGLGSYLYSAGANLVDDTVAPSTLTFSDDSTREALTTVLPLLRDSKVTMSQTRLNQKSAVEWFKQGKVAMITGSRDLVPTLREQSGLNFDVVRVPKIGASLTTANLSGLCISSDTQDADAAADVIADLVDDESLKQIADLGWTVPANVSVAASEAVQQPGQQPANSGAFAQAQKTMRLSLDVPDLRELEKAVQPDLEQLLVATPTLDLDAVTARLDATSLEVITAQRAAVAQATGSPSAEGSATPSASPAPVPTASDSSTGSATP